MKCVRYSKSNRQLEEAVTIYQWIEWADILPSCLDVINRHGCFWNEKGENYALNHYLGLVAG